MPGCEVRLQQRKFRGRARVCSTLGLIHERCLVRSSPGGRRRRLERKMLRMRRPQLGAPGCTTQLLGAPRAAGRGNTGKLLSAGQRPVHTSVDSKACGTVLAHARQGRACALMSIRPDPYVDLRFQCAVRRKGCRPRPPRRTAGGRGGQPAGARAAHRRRASQPRAWRCTRTTAARRAATTADAGVYTPAQRRGRTLTPVQCARSHSPGACKCSRSAMCLTHSSHFAQHNSRSAGMLAAQQYQAARPWLYRARPASQQSKRTTDPLLHRRQGVWVGAPAATARSCDASSTRPRRGICRAASRGVCEPCAAVRRVCVSRLGRGSCGRGGGGGAVWLTAWWNTAPALRGRRCQGMVSSNQVEAASAARADCCTQTSVQEHAQLFQHKGPATGMRSRGPGQVCQLKARHGGRQVTCAAVTEATEEGLRGQRVVCRPLAALLLALAVRRTCQVLTVQASCLRWVRRSAHSLPCCQGHRRRS
jgi:hypothetical protein